MPGTLVARFDGILLGMSELADLGVVADTVIVVSGIPASGKTTLAHTIGERLRVPVISKDTIKEALFDALGTGDLERSRELGRAAHIVMHALAAEQRPVILESFFCTRVAEPDLVGLDRVR